MTTLPNTDTDQVGYAITTELGNAPLYYNTGQKNVAPFVYGTTFEGDTVKEDSVAEAPVVDPGPVDDAGAEAPVVSPEPATAEEATLSVPGIVKRVEGDVEAVVDAAEHDAEVLGEDAVHEAERIETDVKNFVEGHTNPAPASTPEA
jgi:hypothetical protein